MDKNAHVLLHMDNSSVPFPFFFFFLFPLFCVFLGRGHVASSFFYFIYLLFLLFISYAVWAW